MKKDRILNTYTEELPVDLTPDEIRERGKSLAEAERELDAHRIHARGVRKSLTEHERKLQDAVTALATIVHEEKEEREVECVDVAKFDAGIVIVQRTDTGAVVRQRKMTDADRQDRLL